MVTGAPVKARPSGPSRKDTTPATSVGFDPKERFTLYPEGRWNVIAAGDDVSDNCAHGRVDIGRAFLA